MRRTMADAIATASACWSDVNGASLRAGTRHRQRPFEDDDRLVRILLSPWGRHIMYARRVYLSSD
jgi:hypothetical protein